MLKWIKLFENFSENYYRATNNFLGKETIFIPKDFYEAIDKNDNPIYKYDTFWMSNIPEICASKYIGGAVLGCLSMLININVNNINSINIYKIEEIPDKDISHWNIGDFRYIKEVRYRRPVNGYFVGEINLTNEQLELIKLYYEYISADEYDQKYDLLENNKFQEMLNNIKIKPL